MIDLIRQYQKEIEALCRQYRVRQLDLFGSAVTGQAFDVQTSDLDFLVEFLPLPDNQYADTYFGLAEALEQLLGRPVDLVMRSAVKNPLFLQAVTNQCEVVYAN